MYVMLLLYLFMIGFMKEWKVAAWTTFSQGYPL